MTLDISKYMYDRFKELGIPVALTRDSDVSLTSDNRPGVALSKFGNVENIILFDMILQYLIETAGREFSADNIIKYLEKDNKKISNETLYNYIEALCKALILKKVYSMMLQVREF